MHRTLPSQKLRRKRNYSGRQCDYHREPKLIAVDNRMRFAQRLLRKFSLTFIDQPEMSPG
jgi:hypothetical protein